MREPEAFVLAIGVFPAAVLVPEDAPVEDQLLGITSHKPWRGEGVEHVARTGE